MLSLIDGAVSLMFEAIGQEDHGRDGSTLRVRRFIQPDEYSCAVHTCRSLLKYHGVNISSKKLEKDLRTDREEGTDEKKIIRVLRKHGFRIEVMKWASVERLRDAIDDGTPVIVSLDWDQHWGLVHGYDRDQVHLMDPYPGTRQSYKRWDFRRRWNGWGIVAY